MRARASSAICFIAIGAAGGWAAVATADPPVPGAPAVVYSTRTVTQSVQATYQGRKIQWWAHHAVKNRREANHLKEISDRRGAKIRALQHAERARWAPTVDYAIRLASATFNVPYSKMMAVASCESTLNPSATNGRYKGLFQLGWSPFGFSPYDPVANALSAAQTVAHDGSWRQWECG